MQTERCLSDYWRHDRSDDRVLELVSVLQGADNLIGLMGSDIRVTWSGQEVSYTDFQRRIVALDYGPLRDNRTPFPGSQVDEVIGYAAHEGGHCLWSEPGKDQTVRQEISRRWSTLPQALKRAWTQDEQGTLAELCRVQNILEDAYVDCHVAERWEVLGEHIRIARKKLAERRPIDHEAIARQVQEIRRVFDRQQDIQARYLKGLDRGKLDDRRLARVGAGSLNVFQRKQVLERPDLAVGLLLDMSGSMNGFMPVVEKTAAVFAEGLIRKPGVNFAAWTYTGGYAHVELTRICDRWLGKLCLGNVAKGGGTPSGAAIAGVKVLMERMPERKKVVIHFTDGQPDSAHHVERAVQVCRQAGIRVYAIGVGSSMGGSLESQYGNGNWEVISTVAELPQAVARLIKPLDSFQR